MLFQILKKYKEVIMYLIFGALFFNMLLALITSLVTFFVYKRISILFDKSSKTSLSIFLVQ